MAVTSFPSAFGTGDFGPEAYGFVHFLHQAGQRWWQVLPLNPADSVNSPFKSDSSMGFDITYLSVEDLVSRGLIPGDEARRWRLPATPVADFAGSRALKRQAVKLAHAKLPAPEFAGLRAEFAQYRKTNAYWLDAHTRFFLERDAIPEELSAFEQFLLESQWMALKAFANQRGIAVVGDMPIYVAKGSADVLGDPRAFMVDPKGSPKFVSGYPPCPTYQNGQLWDTLLYDWERLRQDGYAYWVKRLRRNYALYDFVRLDHFLGLHRFYAIPASDTHARDGVWMPADGAGMLAHAAQVLGSHRLIAEDLGDKIPEEVPQMLQRFRIPGMRILQFSDGTPTDYHAPQNYPAGAVAYPGNHDMPTLADYLAVRGGDPHWNRAQALARLYDSRANLVIVPAQDLIGLGESARLNVPGTWSSAPNPAQRRDNWVWRADSGTWTVALAAQMRQSMERTRR